MASLDNGSVTAALKQLYPTGVPKKAIYKNSPFIASIKKDTSKLRSQGVVVPFHYTGPQGVSANFTQGRANMTSSEYAKCTVTHKNHYGFAQIDGEVIDAAQGDPGAFIDALKSETDRAIYTMKRRLCRHIFGTGGGALGQISSGSTVASTTISLSQASDVRWFEVGMELKGDTTDGTSGTVHAGSATVTAIDRAAGTLTTDANWSTQITGCAVNDYLFADGDFGSVLTGVEGWVPRVASGSLITSFFGLDRSVDSRLYGMRADLSSYAAEEALIVGAELLARENGTIDFAVMSSVNFRNLQLALGSKIVYDTVEAYDEPTVGHRAIKIAGPTGDIMVMMDPDAPVNRLLMGQLDTWTLYSMGDLVKMLDNDGNAVLRLGTADAVELQLVSRANLACEAPGWNANFQIA
jgi:hypothetical protein